MGERYGIIAGGGDIPSLLIRHLLDTGEMPFILGLKGHVDPSILTDLPHEIIRLGQAGKGFARLKEEGVTKVVMIGNVRRPSLTELRPDTRTAKFIARIGRRALGDDGLLTAVISEIESEGFDVIGIDQILTGLLVQKGILGKHTPNDSDKPSIKRGIEIAKEIGRLDIGQGCVVQDGIVLAVEGVEGTDSMLSRCGDLKRDGRGGVLVKMKKPAQERRVDLPTIGLQTIENAAKAGLSGIVIEANEMLVVEKNAVIAAADKASLFLIAVDPAAEL